MSASPTLSVETGRRERTGAVSVDRLDVSSRPPISNDPSGSSFDRQIASNALWLFVAQVTTLAAGVLVVVTVSRELGPEDLGRWRFAQAVTAILMVLADAGLTGLAIREIARHPERIAAYARPVIFVRLALTASLLLGLAAFLILSAGDAKSAVVTMLVALGLVPAAVSTTYLFQAREELGPVSRIRTAGQVVSATTAIIGTLLLGSLLITVTPFLLVGAVVSTLIVTRAVRAGYLHTDGAGMSALSYLLRPAVPFLVASLAVQVIFNADAFIIRAIRGEVELGLYAAPYSIAGYALILGGAVVGAAYPRIAAHAQSSATVTTIVADVCSVMGVLAVPMSIGTMLVADELVVTLFGEAYLGSGSTLAVLMSLPLIGFLNMTIGQSLSARGLAVRVALVAVLSATTNVVLNLLFVPTMGGVGAAIAVALTELLTMVAYLASLWRSDRIVPVAAYLSCLPATLVMAVCVITARMVVHLPLPALVAIGIGTFLGATAVFPSTGVLLLRSLIPVDRLVSSRPR